jgi:hypothetical protein
VAEKLTANTTFHTYAFLLESSYDLLELAKTGALGSTRCLTAATLFTAFGIEGYLNFVGELKVESWAIVEPRLSWRDKLKLVALQLGVSLDWGQRPLQTIDELFKFRDKLAHGKTIREVVEFDASELAPKTHPKSLEKFQVIDAVERARDDAKQLIGRFNEKAGLRSHVISESSWWG